MKINWILLKQITILSAFFGAIGGVISIIPYIGVLSFVFSIMFMAPFVIWLLVKYNCMNLDTMQEGIITGALSGFISFLVFSLLYIPISVILIKLFSFSANYGIKLILTNSNLFLLIIVSGFFAILSATLNAFSGFFTFCVYDFLRNLKK